MGQDNRIDFTTSARRLDLFQRLLDVGWKFGEGEFIMLLLADDQDYDWVTRGLDFDVWRELRRCAAKDSKMGVTMLFEETGIGGSFVFYPPVLGTFDAFVSLSIDWRDGSSRMFGSPENWVQDISWYLERIVPALNKSDVRQLSYNFNH